MSRVKKNDTLLRIAGVRKGDALRGVDLELAVGEAKVIAADTGAAAATLFDLVLGHELPDAGEVRVFDVDPVQQTRTVLERVGFVPAVCDAPMWMRPRDYFRLVGMHYAEWNEDLADELCESFKVDAARRFGDLGALEQWRLQLLGALTCEPRLLLCDRPHFPLHHTESEALRAFVDDGGAILAVVDDPGLVDWSTGTCRFCDGVLQPMEATGAG